MPAAIERAAPPKHASMWAAPGKITNAINVVHAIYASRWRHATVAARLCLPAEWTADAKRRAVYATPVLTIAAAAIHAVTAAMCPTTNTLPAMPIDPPRSPG